MFAGSYNVIYEGPKKSPEGQPKDTPKGPCKPPSLRAPKPPLASAGCAKRNQFCEMSCFHKNFVKFYTVCAKKVKNRQMELRNYQEYHKVL